jgi:hypothetical protein
MLSLLAKQILDSRVKQEVGREVVDLSSDELEQLLHYSVHNSHSMSADTVQHLVDSDSLYLLSLRSPLNEHLSVEVVVIV